MQLSWGRAAAGAVILLCVMTGCATAPTSSEPTPIPSATETEPPPPRAATPAFGGDCSAAMSDSEAAAASGTATATFSSDWAPARTAGGILCRWDIGNWGTFDLTVYPIDVVPAHIVADHATAGCNPEAADEPGICSSALSTPVAWILIERIGGEEVLTQLPTGFPDALRLIATRLEATGAPAPAERADTWWGDVDCGPFATEVGVAERLGSDFEEGYPGDAMRHIATVIADESGFVPSCEWYGYPDGWGAAAGVTMYPGGAPLWDALSAQMTGGVVVDVAGAENAIAWQEPADATTTASEGVLVTDGVNVARLYLEGSAVDAPAFAAQVLAALAD